MADAAKQVGVAFWPGLVQQRDCPT